MALPKILVLGAGYGGLMTTVGLQKELNQQEAEVTLVNLNSYHHVTTKLHEPAAGTLPSEYAKVDIDSVLDRNKVRFIQDKVTQVDPDKKEVQLDGGETLSYDYLVFGLGSAPETFGIKGLLDHAYFIRNLNGARLIREHMEKAFAEYNTLEEKRDDLLTIVIGGAGFTGIEYVGELVDRLPELCREFDIPREKVRLVNVEAAPTVLPGFDKELVDYAVKYLEERGVEFRISTPIEECTPEGVILKGGEKIDAATVVWTGGVRGNPLLEEAGIETARGRVKVDEYLRAPGYEDFFVVGDSSLIFNEEERPYPPTAQMATQQGQYLSKNLVAKLRGGSMQPFSFDLKGTLASLGRGSAIGIAFGKKFFGGKASFLKRVNDWRWFYLIGGLSLMFKKAKF
ncbi:MAG: NAD(P)/FAD-dependent oxidoreductase [Firmicutes bacterium]|uniref:NADH dehydrogenase n=1 Tax=Melghirimyces thermohalophilus TaxID=1236220 RepID=A0A1G6L6S0_9BACL|nr:NAD(P)/FAD-dependent oxidoreductase [Melghirimyces thermohalophilus]MDA8353734.1 NAD(P)/FAD-dependent oxidoreductase [Bacillota bacterium]SDC38924.1 NADH dehydrogenase [Melghirimyces thermohalophilus]